MLKDAFGKMGEERQSQLQVPRTSNNHLKQQQQSVERVAKQKTANNKAKKKNNSEQNAQGQCKREIAQASSALLRWFRKESSSEKMLQNGIQKKGNANANNSPDEVKAK